MPPSAQSIRPCTSVVKSNARAGSAARAFGRVAQRQARRFDRERPRPRAACAPCGNPRCAGRSRRSPGRPQKAPRSAKAGLAGAAGAAATGRRARPPLGWRPGGSRFWPAAGRDRGCRAGPAAGRPWARVPRARAGRRAMPPAAPAPDRAIAPRRARPRQFAAAATAGSFSHSSATSRGRCAAAAPARAASARGRRRDQRGERRQAAIGGVEAARPGCRSARCPAGRAAGGTGSAARYRRRHADAAQWRGGRRSALRVRKRSGSRTCGRTPAGGLGLLAAWPNSGRAARLRCKAGRLPA